MENKPQRQGEPGRQGNQDPKRGGQQQPQQPRRQGQMPGQGNQGR